MSLKRNLLLTSHSNSKIKILLECYLETSSGFKSPMEWNSGLKHAPKQRFLKSKISRFIRLLMSFPWLLLVMKYFF